jgi:hypothetical protein
VRISLILKGPDATLQSSKRLCRGKEFFQGALVEPLRAWGRASGRARRHMLKTWVLYLYLYSDDKLQPGTGISQPVNTYQYLFNSSHHDVYSSHHRFLIWMKT